MGGDEVNNYMFNCQEFLFCSHPTNLPNLFQHYKLWFLDMDF